MAGSSSTTNAMATNGTRITYKSAGTGSGSIFTKHFAIVIF